MKPFREIKDYEGNRKCKSNIYIYNFDFMKVQKHLQ